MWRRRRKALFRLMVAAAIIVRRSRKKHSLARRYVSLSVRELRIKKICRYFIMKDLFMRLNGSELFPEPLIQIILRKYYYLSFAVIEKPLRNVNLHKTFMDFSETEIDILFRCKRDHLPSLLRAFQLNEPFYRAGNGSIFTAEELLMIGLARFSTTGSLFRTMSSFEKDVTQLSRAVSLFRKHLVTKCGFLLFNNWNYWLPLLSHFAGCIGLKLSELSGENSFVNTTISCLYDCTVIAISRPSSTPLEPHLRGVRRNHNIQRAFYSGHKKHHGIKFLSVEGPNGLCLYLYGPKSFKDCDLGVLRDSELNQQLCDLQIAEAFQYCAYGDGIFPHRSHLRSINLYNPSPRDQLEMATMARIRVANEWSYAVTSNLFPYVKNKYSQKIRHNTEAINNYIVATLLRNAYICLNEGQTSRYFDCPPPSLFEYFRVPP
jgi:nuclease HARBI1